MQQTQETSDFQTIELIPIGGEPEPVALPPWFGKETLKAWLRSRWWFGLLVVVPTVLAVLYFGLLAADRYEVESKFVVRSPTRASTSQIASLVQGSGIVRSSDDAYIVHAYIGSQDAARDLVADVDLLRLLARPSMDLLWRYPQPFLAHNEQRLWKHLKSFIEIDYDQNTGISTLKVQAFDPEDARIIAEALLARAEALINEMSGRSQEEAIRTAGDEVARSRAHTLAVQSRITDFRKQHAIVDPGRTSSAALGTITGLALDTAQTNAQLAELQQASPASPQVSTLRNRIDALEDQIRKERALLAGADASLAPLIAEYERLTLEREFAERTFASAQTALDIARIEGQRQRLFLERISTPSAPDYPKSPHRLPGVLATLAVTWLAYAIGRRLVSDGPARAEH